MSAKYVRDLFRQWCNDAAASEGVPFYDTINQEQNPHDRVWFTCEFFADTREGMFCEDTYQETGQITLVVASKPGIGDGEGIVAIEKLIPYLYKKKDTSAKLTLENWLPVFEDSAGSADKHYRVGTIFLYRHSNS